MDTLKRWKDMWLLMFLVAALVVTFLYFHGEREKVSHLGILGLILWGTTIMVFVDHLMGYISEGGPFFDISMDAFLLSMILLATALIVWKVAVFLEKGTGIGRAEEESRGV